MKAKRIISFLLVVLIIACMVLVNFFGIPFAKVKGTKDSIRYGIDIKGGISAILKPVIEGGGTVTSDKLNSVKAVMDNRLESQNIFDGNVNVDEANKRIIIEIPWKADANGDNPQTALDEIGRTAKLTFREVDMSVKDPDEDRLRKEKADEYNEMLKGIQVQTEEKTTDGNKNGETTPETTISSSPENTVSESGETTPSSSPDNTEAKEITGEASASPDASNSPGTSASSDASASPDTSAKTGEDSQENSDGENSPIDIEEMTPETVPLDYIKAEMWANNEIVLEGEDVASATVEFQQNQGNQTEVVVSLKLNESGKKAFAEATGKFAEYNKNIQDDSQKSKIAIYLDDELIQSPFVGSKISDGKAVIQGYQSMEEAEKIADLISGGALPFKMETQSVAAISAILGQNAMDVTVFAGLISLILIGVFMILLYRLQGIIATIAVIGMVSAQLLIITAFSISLTLPGIAGIILSIGMGVDANIIIFERIKEELKFGKTLRAAIELGFKRAFAAILDGNVTTVITAVMLIFLGSGPIKGFGYTLLIGIVVSFVSAILATRIMLLSLSGFKAFKIRWFYGVGKDGAKNA